jgi:hypothetical protein
MAALVARAAKKSPARGGASNEPPFLEEFRRICISD